jgi:hypothetical protein
MTVGQTQLERAIYEIQHRANVPQLDFTQHQLENGYTISTQERVVQEVRFVDLPTQMLLDMFGIGASARDDHPDRRAVLLKDGEWQTRRCVPEEPLFSGGAPQGGTCVVYHRESDANPPK